MESSRVLISGTLASQMAFRHSSAYCRYSADVGIDAPADLRAARRNPSIMTERHERLRKRAEAERPDEPSKSDVERKLDELANNYAKGKSIRRTARRFGLAR